MKYRKNPDLGFLNLEEYREWKSLDNGPTNIVVNDGEAGRGAKDALDSLVDA